MSDIYLEHENYEGVIHSIYITGGYINLSKPLIKEAIEKDKYITINFHCNNCGSSRQFRFLILDIQETHVLVYTFIKLYMLN